METNKHLAVTTGNVIDTKLFYSIFSGLVYEVPADEVAVLDEGQIPLISRPKPSCNKCYGRGFESFDPKRSIYSACRCLRKCIDPAYTPKDIQIPIEKFA